VSNRELPIELPATPLADARERYGKVADQRARFKQS
jgi:hypothetical protein